MELQGHAFLITGATGALGSRIARRLVDGGASVTLSARSRSALESLEIESAHLVEAELTEPDAPRALVDAAAKHHGRLDGIVAASGIVAFGPAAEVDDDTVDDLILVNLLAPLRLFRRGLSTVGSGGVLVNISAVVAEKPVGGMAAYSAAKAGVSAFSAAVRPEARRAKIRILDVRPPHTETGLADRAVAGTAPKMPTGLDPDAVAERIVAAITGDETDVSSSDFG